MRCSSQTRSGQQCNAAAMRDSANCFLHSSAEAAATVGARGGARRKIFDLAKLKRFGPAKNPADLLRVVTWTLSDLRAGKIDPKTAQVVGSLAAVAATLMRTADLETRIARLEERSKSYGKA